ncbi:MAG: hypothetical protein KH282_01050 [Clostridiales bacterium]|nr:hypothetical protein [Clostridiales bacterium]
MKKITLICLSLLMIAFSFSACSPSNENTATAESDLNSTPSSASDENLINILCDGKWFIDTQNEGPATGEGRYVDYVTFHTDGTYEKMQLVSSFNDGDTHSSIEYYQTLNNCILLMDYEGGTDYIFVLNDEQNALIVKGGILRQYDDYSPVYYNATDYGEETSTPYTSLTACLDSILNNSTYSTKLLSKVTDSIKLVLLSGIWSPISWPSSMSDPETNMYFSNDGYCYTWNDSVFDIEETDIYSEFYQTNTYSIDGNTIQISDGTVLQINISTTELMDASKSVVYNYSSADWI